MNENELNKLIDLCEKKCKDIYTKKNFILEKLKKEFKNKEIEKIVNKFFNKKISKNALTYYLTKNLKLNKEEKKFISYIISIMNEEENIVSDGGLVSIIITTYNRKEFLVTAINSILNQTYKNIEIIVIDDCSSDGTKNLFNNVFKDTRIIYHRNESNKGCGLSRLYAFEHYCKGKYIIFMDDDDFYIDNDYINNAVKIHNLIGNLAFVAADTFIEYPDRVILNELDKYGEISNYEYFRNFMKSGYKKPASTFTAVFSTKILKDSGLNTMKIVNDTSIYLRALLYGNPFFLDKVVGVYKIHGNNLTFSCSLQFIIDNLEEKYKVGVLSKDIFNLDENNYNEWLFEQLYITIIYYLDNSKPSFKEKKYILKWIKNKSQYSYKKFKKIFIKRFLNFM